MVREETTVTEHKGTTTVARQCSARQVQEDLTAFDTDLKSTLRLLLKLKSILKIHNLYLGLCQIK